ncbi:MAG: O-antigen ligase family protein [candidate division Zixibacteria bacterium]|jgi:O-antigen ligase|nr:O-antigen ligase family protein [candidate division Zixibacteria bacterium]
MNALDHRFVDRLLIVFFALFVFSATFSIAASQVMLGLSTAVFLWHCFRYRTVPFSRSLRWFYATTAVWIGWLSLTCLSGDTPLRSLLLSREEWLFVALVIAMYLAAQTRTRWWLMAAFAAGVALVSIYGLIQYFTGVNWFTRHAVYPAPGFGWRVLGMFTHYLTFGNFFAVAACALVAFTTGSRSRMTGALRLLFWSASILAVLITLLTFSRGPIAAMVVTLLLLAVLLGRRYGRTVLIALAILAIGLLAIPGVANRYVGELEREWRGDYEGSRLFIWRHSLEVIGERPLLGVGMGNFGAHYERYLRADIEDSRKLTHAHNDFLNVAAIAGIPGAVAYACMWLVAVGYFWLGWRRSRIDDPQAVWYLMALAGSVCFLGTSMYEATWVDEEVRQLLMVLWGFGFSGWYRLDNSGNPAGLPV